MKIVSKTNQNASKDNQIFKTIHKTPGFETNKVFKKQNISQYLWGYSFIKNIKDKKTEQRQKTLPKHQPKSQFFSLKDPSNNSFVPIR